VIVQGVPKGSRTRSTPAILLRESDRADGKSRNGTPR
jgi:hypothetical protein